MEKDQESKKTVQSMKFSPYPYQEKAINFILETPRAALWQEMGLGKTVITLTALHELLFDRFDSAKVLVICPLMVAKHVWVQEIEKWAHLRGLKAVKVLGTPKQRIEALEQDAELYIINREQTKWIVDYYKKKWPFDTVVLDESHSFKNPSSQRFKAFKKVLPYIDRVIELTGTPASNSLEDLWSQIYLLDEGKALGRTITGYRDEYFVPDKRNQTTIFSYKLKDGAEQRIYEKLDGLVIAMKAKDYLDVPDRIDIKATVTLSKTTQKQYLDLRKDMVLELPDGDIDAVSAGVLCNKLLQFCGGSVYNENGDVTRFHEEKLYALENIIEEASYEPVLVYYAYKHEKDAILERIPGAVEIREQGVIEQWNKGRIPALLAHAASAGAGLNLQSGGHIMVWYTPPYDLELYQQACGRLHRQGQTKPVRIYHIVTSGGLDEMVLDQVLTGKAEMQDALLEALKV